MATHPVIRSGCWGDATCEKMGDLMAANGGRLFGLYDELATFLTQLNLYRGKGLVVSHELALILQLYNGHSWTRATGTHLNSACHLSECMNVSCLCMCQLQLLATHDTW